MKPVFFNSLGGLGPGFGRQRGGFLKFIPGVAHGLAGLAGGFASRPRDFPGLPRLKFCDAGALAGGFGDLLGRFKPALREQRDGPSFEGGGGKLCELHGSFDDVAWREMTGGRSLRGNVPVKIPRCAPGPVNVRNVTFPRR